MKVLGYFFGITAIGAVVFFGHQELVVYRLSDPILVLGDPAKSIYLGTIRDWVPGNSDTIYVLDGDENSVVAFNMEGQFLFRFGREGQGPGEFISPGALTFTGDRMYVTDRRLLRVSEFNSEGNYERSFPVAFRPMSILVHNAIAFIGTFSTTALVLRIPLDDPDTQTSVLDYEHPQLRDIEYSYRYTRPLMTVVEGNLVVCLPNTGQVAVADLNDRNLEFFISKPQTPFIDEYFLASKRRDRERVRPLGGHSLPEVYVSVSEWPGGNILLEIKRGFVPDYDSIAIVYNRETLEEVGIRLISQDKTYVLIKPLGNNRIGWANYSTATVDIFYY